MTERLRTWRFARPVWFGMLSTVKSIGLLEMKLSLECVGEATLLETGFMLESWERIVPFLRHLLLLLSPSAYWMGRPHIKGTHLYRMLSQWHLGTSLVRLTCSQSSNKGKENCCCRREWVRLRPRAPFFHLSKCWWMWCFIPKCVLTGSCVCFFFP